MRLIAQHAMHERKDAFLFVNNRLEGNAPSTIEAVVEKLGGGFATDHRIEIAAAAILVPPEERQSS